MRGPLVCGSEPPEQTSTASSSLSPDSRPEALANAMIRWAAGHAPDPRQYPSRCRPHPERHACSELTASAPAFDTPPRVVLAGRSAPASIPCPALGPGEHPGPRRDTFLQPGTQGRGQVPAGAWEPGTSPQRTRVCYCSQACSEWFHHRHLLWRPGQGPAPLCAHSPCLSCPARPWAPVAPPRTGRPALPSREAMWVQPGPATSCQPLCPQGALSPRVGFRAPPCQPHCETRERLSRLKGGGSGFPASPRDPEPGGQAARLGAGLATG